MSTPNPALNYQRILRECNRTEFSLYRPGKPSAAVPTPEAGGKSRQDGTRRGATLRDQRGAGGCPAASPHYAARKRARLRTARTPGTHPTRGHTRRAEAVFPGEDAAPAIYQEGNYQRMWEEAHSEMSRNPG